MAWYTMFPKEKAKHGYSPKCLFDGKVPCFRAHQIAQHLASTQNKTIEIYRGKHFGSLWKVVEPT